MRWPSARVVLSGHHAQTASRSGNARHEIAGSLVAGNRRNMVDLAGKQSHAAWPTSSGATVGQHGQAVRFYCRHHVGIASPVHTG